MLTSSTVSENRTLGIRSLAEALKLHNICRCWNITDRVRENLPGGRYTHAYRAVARPPRSLQTPVMSTISLSTLDHEAPAGALVAAARSEPERARTSHDARALAAETLAMTPRTIRVDLNGHGAWEITLRVGLDPIKCESLYEARRAAYRFAARWHPCEVVICDAYHRVMHRQLIDSYEDATAYSDHYSQADRGLCFA